MGDSKQAYDEITNLIRRRCRHPEKILNLLKVNKGIFGQEKEGKIDISAPIRACNSTMLHQAAWFCCTPVVKILLQLGANIRKLTYKGETPLLLAAQKLPESKQIVELLVNRGANRYRVAYDGRSPVSCVPGDMKKWFIGVRSLDSKEEAAKAKYTRASFSLTNQPITGLAAWISLGPNLHPIIEKARSKKKAQVSIERKAELLHNQLIIEIAKGVWAVVRRITFAMRTFNMGS
eukprot:1393511-Amorphochlora_amoeboformis.AAC.2